MSLEAEKALDKIHQSNMIKVLENVRIQGAYLNLIKAVWHNPTDKVMLNREKFKSKGFPSLNRRTLSFQWRGVDAFMTDKSAENRWQIWV